MENFDLRVKSMLELVNQQKSQNTLLKGFEHNTDPETGKVVVNKFKNFHSHFKKPINTENIMTK